MTKFYKIFFPKYLSLPTVFSILNNLLYFATLSLLFGAPVFICPDDTPTAKSDMVVSSVSPDRWLIMQLKFDFFANLIALKVSHTVPTWLSLIRIEFADLLSIPFFRYFSCVTNKSSPTS